MPDIVNPVKTTMPAMVASASMALSTRKPIQPKRMPDKIDRQEALARRERQQREQADDDSTVGSHHPGRTTTGSGARWELDRVGMLVFLEANLVAMRVVAVAKRDTRDELVRLRNLVDRFEIALAGDKRERLHGTIGSNRHDRERRGARQGHCAFGSHPEPQRNAPLEDLQHQHAVAGVDPLRLGAMVVTMVAKRAVIVPVMPVSRPEVMMAMPTASRLSGEVKHAKQDQRATGNPGKHVAGPLARLDAEPHDQRAEHRGEQHMTRAAEGDDQQRLRLAPALSAAGQHKGQPMRRNGRMRESDDEPGCGDGKKDRLGHGRARGQRYFVISLNSSIGRRCPRGKAPAASSRQLSR
jgi:hypothetical protein